MKTKEIMGILEEMKLGIFATVDEAGNPHARPIHITAANEDGIFFMTGSETHFYRQLIEDGRVALSALSEEEYLIQVIRIEGRARLASQELLDKVFSDNDYIQHVYKDEESQKTMRIFQIYEGDGFYHSLTQGHRYLFSIGGDNEGQARSL
ncbi:pyridoxamine 5'-phosphate oxidase family protein [Streptococcus suis]|uniref:ABC transporter ATP-binding protein n=1 Tax=Streptococcus suis TaxID=1307 RepID=A0A2Z4PL91_STRSU|nr:pyridoxamine 5'-phosphate oxidase family protein [Streptococcus suis]AWX96195.1 ABC transporter ATP-binding protein [Streptococcus suis]AWX98194.1 ABC transporter ATP-binding protein [Streptococcus suis]MBS8056248.1 pyridoxamine 5'-phosphate oxidase family protein [Streptococcus suis]MCL4943168.1 pyridoxamine 5'-phosphate oxidase family protein [Streptococcus suis]NQI76779.1 pyridoxamine 5'-phosphate oxidase family protein [Streptococcus suis]